MSTQREDKNTAVDTQDKDQAPASNSRRSLLSAALKSTPYALTLVSGASMANASAFQCMESNQNDIGTTDLISLNDADYIRHPIDGYLARYIEVDTNGDDVGVLQEDRIYKDGGNDYVLSVNMLDPYTPPTLTPTPGNSIRREDVPVPNDTIYTMKIFTATDGFLGLEGGSKTYPADFTSTGQLGGKDTIMAVSCMCSVNPGYSTLACNP